MLACTLLLGRWNNEVCAFSLSWDVSEYRCVVLGLLSPMFSPLLGRLWLSPVSLLLFSLLAGQGLASLSRAGPLVSDRNQTEPSLGSLALGIEKTQELRCPSSWWPLEIRDA